MVIFEDDIKFVKRTKMWLPRPPGDAVLCYLGFTYKDDLTENRLEAAIEANREKAWIKVETEYFYVHGCFALMAIGKSNIEEVCRLACDSTKSKCPIDVLYVKHLQQKGKAYICNFQRQPMFTHCNQFLSDATCPGKRIDTSTTPVFGYAEKGRVRPSIERASKRNRPAVQGQPGRPGAAREPPGQFCR